MATTRGVDGAVTTWALVSSTLIAFDATATQTNFASQPGLPLQALTTDCAGDGLVAGPVGTNGMFEGGVRRARPDRSARSRVRTGIALDGQSASITEFVQVALLPDGKIAVGGLKGAALVSNVTYHERHGRTVRRLPSTVRPAGATTRPFTVAKMRDW